MNKKKKYKCPCCGYYTLEAEPGHFDICPVCFWEDDNIQSFDPDYIGGANEISLKQARDNYKRIGAVEECSLKSVRPPTEEEKIELESEIISPEMKKLLAQQHKLDLIRQYHNIQKLLMRTDLSEKIIQKINRDAELIVDELKIGGIVFDKITGNAINELTGLPVSEDPR